MVVEVIIIKEELNRQTKLRSIYFNRYLLFRYATAMFFFINLYWGVLSFSVPNIWTAVPIGLLIIDIAIIIEQTAKYWNPSKRLLFTKAGYAVQISSNLVGIMLIFLGQQQQLFPFINESGRGLLLICLIIGCLAGIVVEWKVWQIEQDKDSYLEHMKIFEDSLEKER
ncbi:hypothetical protein IW492_10675 [Enterococcus sp. BWB1-3]|uniref:hypothetical protein n=1 Tax=unclassified Enterococcus TaxID=2608891 RepID=UPI0019222EA5|nr:MULTISPECIES: hypothetical protein [unclassified Enterococcus]MBL1229694.1 hypothetical protein [Enterococcus sp. BWB1-3]MCB5952830.1 hypothetical protein [Enterococcus sp. BWT-B8]MCB5953835.1 hypothetical protein [Enterococcus sp. CWB-B31]